MGRFPMWLARACSSRTSPSSHTTVPSSRKSSIRPSRHGSPPPVAMISPDFSLSASRATIMSSVSTRQRPRRRASSRPQTDLPAPMNPTSTMLSRRILRIVSDRAPRDGRPGGTPHGLSVHGLAGGPAAVRAVGHPAPRALAEVVVDPRSGAGGGDQGNGLHGGHEAGRVEADTDRVARTHAEQQLLLGHVPAPVAGAHPIRDRQAEGDRLLAEEVVHVLGQALDGARSHAVEHRRERELARLPQLAGAPLEPVADRADVDRHPFDRAPQAADVRDRQRDAAGVDRVGALPRDRQPADDGARRDEAPPQGERVLEERQHLRAGGVDGRLVSLEAEHFVGVDRQRERREDSWRGGQLRGHFGGRRRLTISAIRRMCSGFEPQQAPTMLHPTSRSAGYSRAISSGPSSYVTVSPVVMGSPAFGYATSGASVTCRISLMITIARSGPRPQFMPITSAPAATRFFTTSAGLSPHIVRSRSWISSYWKNMVAITGRSATALQARTAAVHSCGNIMVSTAKRSTPPSASASACSRNVSTYSSSVTPSSSA